MSDPLYGNDRTCWSSKTAEDIIADMRAAVVSWYGPISAATLDTLRRGEVVIVRLS